MFDNDFLLVEHIHWKNDEPHCMVVLSHHEKGVLCCFCQVFLWPRDRKPHVTWTQAHQGNVVHGEYFSRVQPFSVQKEEVWQLVLEEVGVGSPIANVDLEAVKD